MSDTVVMATLPKCDVCKRAGYDRDALYDSKTVHGAWAYLCEACWRLVGVGKLGTGFGQKLIAPRAIGCDCAPLLDCVCERDAQGKAVRR